MNDFDNLRIENAIWILQQYEDQIRFIAKLNNMNSFEINNTFDTLENVKNAIERAMEQ